MFRRPSTRFRDLLVGAAALATVFGCSDLPEEIGGATSDGSLVGELTSYMVNYEDHSEVVHKLLEASGTERTLLLPSGTNLAPGTRLKVWAAEEGDALRVVRHQVLPDSIEVQQQALVGAMAKPTRRWAFVLVDFGTGVNITEEGIRPRLFDPMTPGSIRSYFREVSYGIQDLDGEVFSFTTTASSPCDTGVARRLRPMIPGRFDQYLWYFGARQMGCQWAGLAQLGSATRASQDSWYNASSGCVVLVQEPGHNFGMVHSSAVRCTRGNGEVVPLTLPGEVGATCAHNEYGNPFDPMGRGCYHMNGPQKAYQDWLSGCNVVKVGSSGTFTLFPIEKACNGVQLLQVPLPAPRTQRIGTLTAVITSYFLELRTPVGFDFKPQATANLTPRVLVTISGDVRGATQSGGRNWLLDMTPGTVPVSDGALPVGQEYADPAPDGPRFTVLSADMEKAIIRVTLPGGGGMPEAPGRGTCGDTQMPFTAPGPATCDAPPPTPATPVPDAGAPPQAPDASAPPPQAPDASPSPAPSPDALLPPGPGADPAPPPVSPDAGAAVSSGGGIDDPTGTGGTVPPPPAPAPIPSGGGEAPPPPGMGAAGPSPPSEPIEAPPIPGGCSCSTGPGTTGAGPIGLLGVAGLLVIARRRRRPV